MPTSGRAWQTTLALMPGVAQPNYYQSGGSNNPTRAMAITINGQPANNTVVRLDGVSQINQFFQQIQAYSPSLEAIETVSVVTNSFDADQGMAGGASVNVQVKSGTNHAGGIAVRVRARLPDEGEELFPACRRSERQRQRRTSSAARPAVPSSATSCSTSPAWRRTRQRTTAGNALSNSGANGLRSLPTMAMRDGQFRRHRTPCIYDPRTGAANGSGRVPFAFANCGLTSTTDPRFDSCNYIPANRISPIATDVLEQAGRADTAGISVQLLRDEQATTRTTESTTARSRGCRITGLPSTDGSATRQATRTAHPHCRMWIRWDRQEWPRQPDLAGAHLGLHGPQSLVGDHQHRLHYVGRGRRVRVYAHGHAGSPAHG